MSLQIQITPAAPCDAEAILDFIKALAVYERLETSVTATAEQLRLTLFGEKPYAEVIFLEESGVKVGFALFFHKYSTFLAKPGIYLEDLFVKPQYRGRGYGKKLLSHLAALTLERGGGRLEWSVLDWNKPSIDFYLSLGAQALDEWTAYRLDGDRLLNLAKRP